jgi:receptor protein-tyrosine kinase
MLSATYPAEWKEQVRQLRNRLGAAQSDLQLQDESLQVVAFTNMANGHDRFGTAANLALAMASIQDTRVLVVDANLATPSLHSALRIPAGPGLCEATRASRESLPACFRRVAGSQVYFLTAGEITSSSIDPIDLRGLHILLRSLRAQFDWVFIDAPAFDSPADAMAITMASDGVIMMIESEHDSFRDVARALGQVQGRRMLGAIMF